MVTTWSPPVWSDMATPREPLPAVAEPISGTSGSPVGARVVTPWSPRILFFAVNNGASLFTLLEERFAIPIREISRRCLAEIPLFRQSPMGCLAVAVNAMVGGADHDNEAVMLKLAKPQHNAVPVTVLPKLFLSVARG